MQMKNKNTINVKSNPKMMMKEFYFNIKNEHISKSCLSDIGILKYPFAMCAIFHVLCTELDDE